MLDVVYLGKHTGISLYKHICIYAKYTHVSMFAPSQGSCQLFTHVSKSKWLSLLLSLLCFNDYSDIL